MKIKLSNRKLRQAAQLAVTAPPPPNGAPYATEAHIGHAAKAQYDKKPYFAAERRKALGIAAVGALGLAGCVLAGLSYLTIGLGVAATVTISIGLQQALYKKYPMTVTHDTLEEAHNQLIESGEQHQAKASVVGEIFTAGLCCLDGFLTGGALASQLGASVLSPRMAVGVGAVVAIILTAALWHLLHAAAQETRQAKARRAILALEESAPAQALCMKERLGGALGYAYGPANNTIRMRVSLVALVLFMAMTSFTLRMGAFIDSEHEKEQQMKEEFQAAPQAAPTRP